MSLDYSIDVGESFSEICLINAYGGLSLSKLVDPNEQIISHGP